jgi:MFS family permease
VLAAIATTIAISFSVLLPVVPVLLERRGPHGAAGAATAALFLGAVFGEWLTPWLLTRFSSARLLVAGQLLTAVPSLVYVLPHPDALQMLGGAGLRGLGMGVSIVVSVALVAELSAPHRRGRSIGYFGLALSVPGIVMPSIGVSLLDAGHADVAAVIACVSGCAGAFLATRLPPEPAVRERVATNILGAFRLPGVLALFVGFALVSCSFGAIVTYAPVALPAGGLGSAAVFLFVSGGWRAASRWLAGVLGDHQPARLVLLGGLALSLFGLVLLAIPGGAVTVIVSATAYGIGYGAVQTGVYLVMTERGSSAYWGAISALWNSAIDFGASLGGVLLGFGAAWYGYGSAIWIMPAVMLLALPLFLWPGLPAVKPQADSATGSTG